MFGVMGVLAALYERERSGRGQHVDISMLDCQISMLNYMATMHFLSGENPYPIGNSPLCTCAIQHLYLLRTVLS